jgi:hypothetical protein
MASPFQEMHDVWKGPDKWRHQRSTAETFQLLAQSRNFPLQPFNLLPLSFDPSLSFFQPVRFDTFTGLEVQRS